MGMFPCPIVHFRHVGKMLMCKITKNFLARHILV